MLCSCFLCYFGGCSSFVCMLFYAVVKVFLGCLGGVSELFWRLFLTYVGCCSSLFCRFVAVILEVFLTSFEGFSRLC